MDRMNRYRTVMFFHFRIVTDIKRPIVCCSPEKTINTEEFETIVCVTGQHRDESRRESLRRWQGLRKDRRGAAVKRLRGMK